MNARRLLLFASLAAALLAAGGWLLRPPAPFDAPRVVVIEPGDTLRDAADALAAAGVIRHPWLLRLGARRASGPRIVRPGRYQFPGGEGPEAILARLARGGPAPIQLVIPEGFTLADAAGAASRALGWGAADYLEAAADSALRAEFGIPSGDLEGYLFPATYGLFRRTSARELVRMQLAAFRAAFTPAWLRRAAELGLTVHQAVTLASIIEREAQVPEERARIAAVFHNRLRAGMPLQADPTVRYAAGVWNRPLTRRDLATDSPWNTYRVKGLPPGPICNPGRAALEAALFPLDGSGEYYFVARGDGRHHFSRTLADHERARRAGRARRPQAQER